jgi:cytochrome c
MTGVRGAAVVAVLALCGCTAVEPTPDAERWNVGRPATAQEVAAWDVDVNGSGDGLPPGRGSAEAGRALYARRCAACHGPNGEGGAASRLVRSTDPTAPPRRTIASHWPYAPPLFDYIRRTMPPAEPWSLTADETYALVAFLLAENGILEPPTELDAASLRAVRMPAHARFVADDRRGGPVVQ